ncbi:MAG TPA: acyl-CoA synthase [Mycobacteriales bacterium]|nr:acyl-CoA synthase [Mycobacteriales bacterium]
MSDDADLSVPLTRPHEDDQDLLTYGEAGVRLQDEVAAERARVAELEAAGEDASQARTRLAALEEAAQRHGRQRINDKNFETFFGYAGSARRSDSSHPVQHDN